MTLIRDLVQELESLKIKVTLNDEKLSIKAPKGALTDGIKVKLKENKEALLDYLQSSAPPKLQKLQDHEEVELSSFQKKLWLLSKFEMANNYNGLIIFEIKGNLNSGALSKSVDYLFEHQESLRLRIVEKNDVPYQETAPFEVNNLSIHHLNDDSIDDIIKKESQFYFDLEGQLAFFHLYQLNDNTNYLLFNLHHHIFDGWSLKIIINTLSDCYEKFSNNQEVSPLEKKFSYKEYTHWHYKKIDFELDKLRSFWKEELEGVPHLLEFPKDEQYPAKATLSGKYLDVHFTEEEQEAIRGISQELGASYFQVAYSIFALMIFRFSGKEDFLLGNIMANRPDSGLEDIIGYFANTNVARIKSNPEQTFEMFFKNTRGSLLRSMAHSEMPFETIVEMVNPERSVSYPPLVQIMFSGGYSDAHYLPLKGLETKRIYSEDINVKFDLSWQLQSESLFTVEYSLDIFTAETISHYINSFKSLTLEIAKDTTRKINDYSLLNNNDKDSLFSFNPTHQPKEYSSVAKEFEKQVTENSEKIAIHYQKEKFTYKELGLLSSKVANFLHPLSISPESPIAIYGKKTPAIIATMFGIIRSGNAYVPLDPDYPTERLQYILNHSQCKYIITDMEDIPWELGEGIQCLRFDLLQENNSFSPVKINPDQLTYILYTSGSTGNPKGVAIEHRNVMALRDWALEWFKPDEYANVLAATSLCFDLSVFEILVTLTLGGSITLCDNALELYHLPNVKDLTLLNTVPSVCQTLMDSSGIPDNIKTVILCGEYLPQSLVENIYADTKAERVYDLYGPTEDTVYSTGTLRKPGVKAHIGKPQPNSKCFVLDQSLNILPPMVSGELYLAGDGLARGYYLQDNLTRERFIESPYLPGERIYKSGDVARWTHEGNLEYMGRADNQIKLRGFRIELDEITAVADSLSPVKKSITTCFNEHLYSYVVWEDEINENELQKEFQTKLPNYMVPSKIITLDSFPMTPNGKIDKKAIPLPTAELEKYEAPQTPTEIMLEKTWGVLLNQEQISIKDHFFKIGGHSLLVVKMMNKVNEILQQEIATSIVFQYPTLGELAKEIDRRKGTSHKMCNQVSHHPDKKVGILWILDGIDIIKSNFGDTHNIWMLESYYDITPSQDHFKYSISDFVDEMLADFNGDCEEYVIGGFSVGGLMAYEAARKLQLNGTKIKGVLMLDPAKIYGSLNKKEKILYKLKQYSNWKHIINVAIFIVKLSHQKAILKKEKRQETNNYVGTLVTRMYGIAAKSYQLSNNSVPIMCYARDNYPKALIKKWQEKNNDFKIELLECKDHMDFVKEPYLDEWLKELKIIINKT